MHVAPSAQSSIRRRGTRSTHHRDISRPVARSREIEEGAQRLPRLVALGGESDQIERGVEVHL